MRTAPTPPAQAARLGRYDIDRESRLQIAHFVRMSGPDHRAVGVGANPELLRP
jgi:hypothetical protein